ncbi:glycosyltransferase 18, Xyloglucan L-side chain galactosylTransferase position 2 [Hibiscus trionum]|uniref:Glycosyltransferase 18, Xyloglucan L-side chain galactosylTransferase position 2 n=1 Tax=Hibiscus trionum TaxID=183268 RepID=A0A9W7GS20_HIBTR|nr:glycosyltransferase 18, Xyloglucan L-side chain galactosylTransferase position 2 [Hibiscus trionum]
MEVIYHNRILNHECRTTEPDSATAFYIPFYTDQPYWNRSDGWDHFMTVGRITWDFRRSKNEDWGSSYLYMPSLRNITRLLIERNPWDYFDVGVPHPTGFNPRSDSDVVQWKKFVRNRRCQTLICFAGAPRSTIKNDFRGLLLSQYQFLDSNFCLQLRGDSFSRRSVFDCMIAGSIPVFFWHRTTYLQYQWFLPNDPKCYFVFIHRDLVKNRTSIKTVLENYSREEVNQMKEKVIQYIPKLVYAKPEKGLEKTNDAFDIAIDDVLQRIKEQEQPGFKWK